MVKDQNTIRGLSKLSHEDSTPISQTKSGAVVLRLVRDWRRRGYEWNHFSGHEALQSPDSPWKPFRKWPRNPRGLLRVFRHCIGYSVSAGDAG